MEPILSDCGDSYEKILKSWEKFFSGDSEAACGPDCSARIRSLVRDIKRTTDELESILDRFRKLQKQVADYGDLVCASLAVPIISSAFFLT
jgi:hypothetical protein